MPGNDIMLGAECSGRKPVVVSLGCFTQPREDKCFVSDNALLQRMTCGIQ